MIEKIVPVNGYWIRQTLDPDFAIFHRHGSPSERDYSRKPYVPKGELWVDHRQLEELTYLLEVDGQIADLSGTAYSRKRQAMREALKSHRQRTGKFIISQKQRAGGLIIVYVNGQKVRRYIHPEFVQGGHYRVYPYVPEGQIWIDGTMDPRDYPHVEVHEIRELDLMSQGETYDIAHEIAMAYEKKSRVAAGGCYPGFENPQEYTPQRLLKYYFDLTK